jgi:hypothetical protein
MGGERHRVRELRDACVFDDTDGETYLLYCGAGQSGIGIAKLKCAPGNQRTSKPLSKPV